MPLEATEENDVLLRSSCSPVPADTAEADDVREESEFTDSAEEDAAAAAAAAETETETHKDESDWIRRWVPASTAC